MFTQEPDIQEINRKIAAGRAVVLTETEMRGLMAPGRSSDLPPVDVVAMSFPCGTAGAAFMLCVPVAARGVFTRAARIWLNGIEGHPGPAPNERLGLVDALVFTDEVSRDRGQGYTGADLLLDLIRGTKISVECRSIEGGWYTNEFHLNDLQFARIYSYNSFLPEIGTDGTGENSAWNFLVDGLGVGGKVLLNKAPGLIIGEGTRSAFRRRSLSLTAELFEMDPGTVRRNPNQTGGSLCFTIGLALPLPGGEAGAQFLARLEKEISGEPILELDPVDREISLHLKDLLLGGRFMLVDSAVKVKF